MSFTEAFSLFRQEKTKDGNFNHFKSYLFKSQLSVVANSSFVKMIMMDKKTKELFSDSIKKILDEKILEKEFIENDRPLKDREEIKLIR